jgi:hypothetical protein
MPEGVTMSYNQIKQCKNQLINTVTSTDATGDATLGVTNRTFETVLSNYLGVGAAVGPKLMELRDYTNGVILSFECSNASEIGGAAEIWGLPYKGDAEKIGSLNTITAGTQETEDGNYWATSMLEDTEVQTMEQVSGTNIKALNKFDSMGYKYILVLVTAKTSASSTIKVWARPW